MADRKNGREARVTHGVHHNRRVVFIPLTKGRRAIVDAEDWPRIEREYGRRWKAIGDGQRRLYATKDYRDELGIRHHVTLARAVKCAEPGDRVECVNGDSLDCRAGNLHKLRTVAALKRRREYAEKRAQRREAQRGGGRQ